MVEHSVLRILFICPTKQLIPSRVGHAVGHASPKCNGCSRLVMYSPDW
jgi:hypothetical protein